MMPGPLHLQEYQTTRLKQREISEDVGRFLWERYRSKIEIEIPTFKNDYHWEFTPQGWAGHIPLSEDLHCLISPKTEISNIFSMLEYAYNLPFLAEGDFVHAGSFDELYDSLAGIIARRVLDRSRRGFYREYVDRTDRLPYLRGKVNLAAMLRPDTDVSLDCSFQEHTSDIMDNRILLWTLHIIARNGLRSDETSRLVRRAYRAVSGAASRQVCTGDDCSGRMYNRLNADYESLHALCKFFLDQSGPDHRAGENRMLPFLINMAALYEGFVTEWLKIHLPPVIALESQVPVYLGQNGEVRFKIDQLLLNRENFAPICLLDTKYKVPGTPSSDDLQQVIAYAKARGCPNAVLVYPEALATPFEDTVGGDIQVWSASFRLDGDLEANGQEFLRSLLGRISV